MIMMKRIPYSPPTYGIKMHPIFLAILHITLFLKVKTSNLTEANLLLLICIGGSIFFFIFDSLTTTMFYHTRLQYNLTFYLAFPAFASFGLYRIGERQHAYNMLFPNIVISIVYISFWIFMGFTFIATKIHEKYYEKQKLECDVCNQIYIIRSKEYRKHMDYVNLSHYENIEDKPVIICMKCFECDPRFKNSKIVNNKAPAFTLINPKAKRLVKKKITTVIDGETLGTQVYDIEVNV